MEERLMVATNWIGYKKKHKISTSSLPFSFSFRGILLIELFCILTVMVITIYTSDKVA